MFSMVLNYFICRQYNFLMTIFNLKVLYTRFLSVNLISIDFFICNLVNVISRNQNAFKTDKYAIRKINMVKTIFIQKINVFGIVYILLKILQHNSYKRRWTKCCTSAQKSVHML